MTFGFGGCYMQDSLLKLIEKKNQFFFLFRHTAAYIGGSNILCLGRDFFVSFFFVTECQVSVEYVISARLMSAG